MIDLQDVFRVCGSEALFLWDGRWWLLEEFRVDWTPFSVPVTIRLRGVRGERPEPVKGDIVGVVPADSALGVMSPEILEFVRHRTVRAWRFVTRKEAEEMENNAEKPFWFLLRVRKGEDALQTVNGGGTITRFATERSALDVAESHAKSDSTSDFFVCRPVSASRSTAVTTTRIP